MIVVDDRCVVCAAIVLKRKLVVVVDEGVTTFAIVDKKKLTIVVDNGVASCAGVQELHAAREGRGGVNADVSVPGRAGALESHKSTWLV